MSDSNASPEALQSQHDAPPSSAENSAGEFRLTPFWFTASLIAVALGLAAGLVMSAAGLK